MYNQWSVSQNKHQHGALHHPAYIHLLTPKKVDMKYWFEFEIIL